MGNRYRLEAQEAARLVMTTERAWGHRAELEEEVQSLIAAMNRDVERELRRAYLLGKADLLAEITGEPRAQVKDQLAYRY